MHGRKKNTASITLAATILLLLAWASPAQAQFEIEPVTVGAKFTPDAVRAGGELRLEVRFEIAPGVHIYRDEIRFVWDALEGLKPAGVELPPSIEIEDASSEKPGAMIPVYEGSAVLLVRFAVTAPEGGDVSLSGKVEYQCCSEAVCYPPQSFAIERDLGAALAPEPGETTPVPAPPPGPAPTPAPKTPPGPATPLDLDFGFLLLKILQAFGIGLLISLTPCMYPMIGITAAIIGGDASGAKRNVPRTLFNSLVYVFGLSLTYALLGVLTALVGAPFAQVLKSAWVLLPVSVIFVVLALSMFDVIQIQTPAFIQNRLSGVGRKGKGVADKFALGLVSGIVATPCVAAPLIAVMVEIIGLNATHGTITAMIYGFVMLFSLAWGMGVVLILAGVLTANALPRSGAWMVWIKKLFGFGMLWAAVYFASPVIGGLAYDLVTALLIFTAVVFLGGIDRLDQESGFFDRFKKAVALPALVMAVLLFAGAVNGLTELFPWLDRGNRPASLAQEIPGGFRKGAVTELEEAARVKSLVVLDFNATWCKVCKKLDRETLSDPRVVQALDGVEALKIDYDENPDLVKRFRILGVPTVVFLDREGREVESLRFSGDLAPEPFLEKLDALKGR